MVWARSIIVRCSGSTRPYRSVCVPRCWNGHGKSWSILNVWCLDRHVGKEGFKRGRRIQMVSNPCNARVSNNRCAVTRQMLPVCVAAIVESYSCGFHTSTCPIEFRIEEITPTINQPSIDARRWMRRVFRIQMFPKDTHSIIPLGKMSSKVVFGKETMV